MSTSNAQFVSSLAGTGKRYVKAQAAPDTTAIHVQVPAADFKGKNRPYGYTFDLVVPAEVMANVRKAMGAVQPSLSKAGTYRKYLPIQLTTIGYDGKLHVQAQDGELNRKYGLAFTVKANSAIVGAIETMLEMPDYEAPKPAAPTFKPIAPKLFEASVKLSDTAGVKVLDSKGDLLVSVSPKGAIHIELPNGTLDINGGTVAIKDSDTQLIEKAGDVTVDALGADCKVKLSFNGVDFTYAE